MIGKVPWLGILLVAMILMAPVFVLAQQSDTIPPDVPTGISASLTQSFQVYVSWGSSADNVGVEGYYLYRNGLMIANTPGLTYYTDTPAPGVYVYTVAAYDASGNISSRSGQTQNVTIVADTTPPSTPANLSLVPSSSSVTLSWGASTDDFGVVGYYVYRNGVRLFTPNAITATTYQDTGLLPSNTFTYFVVAYDAAGNTSPGTPRLSVTTIFDITPPSVPPRPSASVVSSNQINLTWLPSTDNVALGGYYLYRDGTQIATVTTSSYADSGLSPQTSYVYTVSAYDTVGNVSSQSFPTGASTLAVDVAPPSAPNNFYGTALSPSAVNLIWSPSTDNVGVAGYNLYRDGDQIAAIASTTYSDMGLTTSTTYTYAITAYDAAGNVSSRASLGITTLAYTPNVPVPPAGSVPLTTGPSPAVASSPTNSSPSVGKFVFVSTLYLGLRTNDVKNLQSILIQQGDLGANYATGFFGALTQSAVQKFQCVHAIVCSGGPYTTGWGSVGPKTRKFLNAM